MSASVAKNTMYMTMASVGQKVISFIYFTLIARTIGAEGTGKYFLALSLSTVFVIFVDLGLTNVLVREAAKMKENIQEYLSTVLSIKVILGGLTYVALVFTVGWMGYDEEIKHLVYLSGITMLFDSLHLSLYGVLRAKGVLQYEAAGIVGSQLLTLVLGSAFLFAGLPIIYLILAFTIPSVLNALYAAGVLVFKYRISVLPLFHRTTFQHLFRIVIPFAIAAVFARLYSYADTILLSKLMDETAVGWYSIPYKITYAFQFIPLALIAAVYPRFSEFFGRGEKGELARIFQQSVKYLLLVAFPIAAGIFVLAEDIIFFLYTEEYRASILPLKILIMSLLFSYVSFPIGAFLNACNRQITQTVIVGVVLVTNVALNLLLIPKIGVAGAATAAFAGNLLLTIAGYAIVPDIARISHRFMIKTVLQLGFAAFLMGTAVFGVRALHLFPGAAMNLFAAIATGVLAYPVALFLTRSFTKNELKEAWQLVRR